MGIHELSKVIGDKAPSGVKENEMKNLFGAPNRTSGVLVATPQLPFFIVAHIAMLPSRSAPTASCFEVL